MFDIGFLELLVLGIVGLLVLGPERLPKAARTLGLWVGKIKRTVSGMQQEINAQLEAEELRQKLKEQQTKLDASLGKAKREVESLGDTPAAPERRSAPQDAPPPAAAARLDDALTQARDSAAPGENSTADAKDATPR